MALAPGHRIGPYDITATLGAGGMGEVYKATDTRLHRAVAIKVLPEHVSGDSELRERFEREAKTLAALSHPNICPVFDVGRQSGIDFLVMEYLEGETLEQRLTQGALKLDQALRAGIQIADALTAAHRASIVHRDLKPGNIMLTKTGAKLLDFGLAKAGAPALAGSLSILPTTPPNLTAQGAILGTFQYMAPEQLEGHEADSRTDIFAFGCVLYEMATGQKPFGGKSQASVIAAILEREPPAMSSIQPLTPHALDHLVRRCLAKKADDRWQSARDLTEELKWIADIGQSNGTNATVVRRSRRERLAWLIAGVSVVMVVLAALVLYFAGAVPERHITRFDIVTAPTSDPTSFALSHDGRELAFIANVDGAPRIWIRPLDSLAAHSIAGTEDASHPFGLRTVALLASLPVAS
jgi:serine/threonine protein kinase